MILGLDQGKVNGSMTGTFDADGNLIDAVYTKNGTMDAYSSIATLSTFQWCHDMNDLTKRMGELRMSPEGVGSGARIGGSKQTYGVQSIKAKNNSIQVGLDTDVGYGWKVGATFTTPTASQPTKTGRVTTRLLALRLTVVGSLKTVSSLI